MTVSDALRLVEGCLNDIVSWMHINMLKLNADKTEVELLSAKYINKIHSDLSINVGGATILRSNCAGKLGVWLDSKMNIEKHVNSVCRSCYAQLRQIGHIRQYLTIDAT